MTLQLHHILPSAVYRDFQFEINSWLSSGPRPPLYSLRFLWTALANPADTWTTTGKQGRNTTGVARLPTISETRSYRFSCRTRACVPCSPYRLSLHHHRPPK